MMDMLTIQANLDVLNHYHKQKSEFHFQQKSDNDFLMFLLDTAVRVISIVQHLAPVIEAVSAASNDPLDTASDQGEHYNSAVNHLNMEVDSIVEDQQLALDIPSVPLPPPPVPEQHISPEQLNTISELEKELKTVTESLSETYPPINNRTNPAVTPAIAPISAPRNTPAASYPSPLLQPGLTATPSSTTPISDNFPIEPQPSEHSSSLETEHINIKPELPVPEVIIKEELMETPQYSDNAAQYSDNTALSQILSSDHINQLMSNVVGELSTADTPSYVTANKAANPLSMLHLQNNPSSMLGSSLASSSEQMSLMNALFPNQEGLDPGCVDSKDRKAGPSNSREQASVPAPYVTSTASASYVTNPFLSTKPSSPEYACEICKKCWQSPAHLKRHMNSVHLKLRPYQCVTCKGRFGRKDTLKQHREHCMVREGFRGPKECYLFRDEGL